MTQLIKLLRARCAYCNHLRLHPVEVHRFACKLTLIHHGLVQEAADLENIHQDLKTPKEAGEEGPTTESSGISDDDNGDQEASKIIQKRTAFVKRAIKRAGGKRYLEKVATDKIEAVRGERRAVIKEFMASITRTKTCGTCNGYERLMNIRHRIDAFLGSRPHTVKMVIIKYF